MLTKCHIVSFSSVRGASIRILLVIQNACLVLQIQHLILAELVARVKKVTTDHLIWQIVKVYMYILVFGLVLIVD